MKSSIYLSLGLLLPALFFSCELLPDLNPNTSAGADILVMEENRVVLTPYLSNSGDSVFFAIDEFGLDITSDGITDIHFEIYYSGPNECSSFVNWVTFSNGTLLTDTDFYPIFLDDTYNNSAIGFFRNSYLYLTNSGVNDCFNGNFYPPTQCYLPNGLKYVLFKQKINGKAHYGWLEFDTNINSTDGTGQSILKRIALAQQPGYVLRAGQTE